MTRRIFALLLCLLTVFSLLAFSALAENETAESTGSGLGEKQILIYTVIGITGFNLIIAFLSLFKGNKSGKGKKK